MRALGCPQHFVERPTSGLVHQLSCWRGRFPSWEREILYACGQAVSHLVWFYTWLLRASCVITSGTYALWSGETRSRGHAWINNKRMWVRLLALTRTQRVSTPNGQDRRSIRPHDMQVLCVKGHSRCIGMHVLINRQMLRITFKIISIGAGKQCVMQLIVGKL